MNQPSQTSNQPKKKRVFLWVILGILALLILGAIYVFFVANKKEETAKSLGGDLSLVSGTVMMKTTKDGTYQETKQGAAIHQDYYLKTAKDSKAIIVFDTGDVVRLNAETEVKISSITSSLVSVDELSGEVYSRVEAASGKNFKVIVDKYPAVSVGTAYQTKYNLQNKEIEYKVLASNIKVGLKEETQVKTAQKATLKIQNGEVSVSDMTADDLKDTFTTWNKEQDEKMGKKVEAYDKITNAQTEQEQGDTQNQNQNQNAISLTGSETDNGVDLSWEVGDIDYSHGFKVLKAAEGETPTFPGSDYQYLSDPNTRSYTWVVTTGETYRFRVCTYNGSDACVHYSNIVSVKTPQKDNSSKVSGITLSGSKTGSGKVGVSWSANGTSSLGFKVVFSENSGPTYPCRAGDEYHYLSDQNATSDTITGLTAGKTYHFRVCEYLGGACGTYSNEISVNL